MQVTGLFAYPLKSGRPRSRSSSAIGLSGLLGDRRWTVVDRDGETVSARTHPRLFLIDAQTADLDGISEQLRLSATGYDELLLASPTGPPAQVTVFGSPTPAVFAGEQADAWIGDVLQADDVRLVWCPDPTVRQLDRTRSEPGDSTAFADGFPILLATEASLAQFNDWAAATAVERGESPNPLPMSRFRPNIVLDGDHPFAEDGWSEVIIGDGAEAVRLRSNSPCKRCVMTTIDSGSLERGPEPIRTLARHRRGLGGTLFAINLVPDRPGRISLGDPVRVC